VHFHHKISLKNLGLNFSIFFLFQTLFHFAQDFQKSQNSLFVYTKAVKNMQITFYTIYSYIILNFSNIFTGSLTVFFFFFFFFFVCTSQKCPSTKFYCVFTCLMNRIQMNEKGVFLFLWLSEMNKENPIDFFALTR
jgi:hypothetical protein